MNSEAIYSALFAQLQNATTWTTCSRRLKAVQDVQPEEFPAAYQLQSPQTSKYQGSAPGINILRAHWLIYAYNADVTEAPSSVLNPLIDAVRAALAPQGLLLNTLGGLVTWVGINGDIEVVEGVLGDRALAVIPIEIQLPGF